MKMFLTGLLLVVSNLAFSQVLAPLEVLMNRVFQIADRNTNATATAFTLEIDQRQYLITAKHVLPGIKDGETILLRIGDKWQTFPVQVINLARTNTDIVVLIPPRVIAKALPIDATIIGMYLGQDVNFFGFPYKDLHTSGLIGIPNPQFGLVPGEVMVTPFIKRGLVSAMQDNVIWLDGINNPGFSGGPVVCYNRDTRRVQIIAVVSGYLNASDAVRLRGQPTELLSLSNSGIIKSYMIEDAVAAIRSRPEGPKVEQPTTQK